MPQHFTAVDLTEPSVNGLLQQLVADGLTSTCTDSLREIGALDSPRDAVPNVLLQTFPSSVVCGKEVAPTCFGRKSSEIMIALTVEEATLGLSLKRQQDQVMHDSEDASHHRVWGDGAVTACDYGADTAGLEGHFHVQRRYAIVDVVPSVELPLHFASVNDIGALVLPQRFVTAGLTTPCEQLPQRVDGHPHIQHGDVGLHPAGGEVVDGQLQPLVADDVTLICPDGLR